MEPEKFDFNKNFMYENGFYQTAGTDRIGKLIAHYELFKKSVLIAGDIVECGVFKGNSMLRFCAFADLLGTSSTKKFVCFDTFAEFPGTLFAQDQHLLDDLRKTDGDTSISVSQLKDILAKKQIKTPVELVEGDIAATVPKYVAENPLFRISLLHIDVDIYEPTKVILDYFYPLVVPGGIIILDDYGEFHGETAALENYIKEKKLDITIFRLPYARTPCYMIKK